MKGSGTRKVRVETLAKTNFTFTGVVDVISENGVLHIALSEGFNKYYVFPIANVLFWSVEDE